MKSFEYTITDELGVHARPAGMLAKEAQRYKSEITIQKDGKEVDIRRLIAVMSMGIKFGETVTVKIVGEDEETTFSDMKAFFEKNL